VSVQSEITAQRQALVELDALRSHARRMSELELVGFWERHWVTGRGDADATARRLLDVEAGEALPSWTELAERATAVTRPALQAAIERLARGEERCAVEFALRDRRGNVVQLHAIWTREGEQVFGVLAEVGSRQASRG
jgi:hypothetical protein